jgi:spore coat protein CotH
MHRGRLALVPLLVSVVLLADAGVARAQAAADLFNSGVVQEMKLFINSRDLAALRRNYLDNTYYPADLEWRGIRVRNIAVRSRGAGSRDPNKLGLRLDFNHYVKAQTFVGLGALDLRNLIQDPSMMHEQIGMNFFARMGQPASRESFCKIFINGVYQGLYGLVEEVDETYLSRTLNENAGYLFEYHWLSPFFFAYPGDDLALYKPILEAKTHALEPDAIVYSPIRDMFREANGPDDAVWRDRVEALIDLKQFVTYVAIENFLAEWDGMTGNFGMNNFYFYRSGATTPHRVIVWDRSEAFKAKDSSIFLRTEQNVLFTRAMAYPDLKTLYLDVLQQCADSATADSWLAGQVAQYTALISDLAHQDPHKLFTNEEVDAGLQFMAEFAIERPAFVTLSVAFARGPLPE